MLWPWRTSGVLLLLLGLFAAGMVRLGAECMSEWVRRSSGKSMRSQDVQGFPGERSDHARVGMRRMPERVLIVDDHPTIRPSGASPGGCCRTRGSLSSVRPTMVHRRWTPSAKPARERGISPAGQPRPPSPVASTPERHGPGGPAGLQNLCGVVTPRSVGSTPAPLRWAVSGVLVPIGARSRPGTARPDLPLKSAQDRWRAVETIAQLSRCRQDTRFADPSMRRGNAG